MESGYKQNKTIGASISKEPFLFGVSILVLITSMMLHSNPLFQAAIMLYLLAGIVCFRNEHLTERMVIILSPFYILLGVVVFVYMIEICDTSCHRVFLVV